MQGWGGPGGGHGSGGGQGGGWGPPGGHGAPGGHGHPGGHGPPAGWAPPGGGWPPQPQGRPPAQKKGLSWPLILLIVVVVGFGACITLGVIVSPDEEEQKVLAKERKPLIDNAVQRFATIRARMPELAALRETRCPDQVLTPPTSEAPHYFVDYDYLEKFTNPAFDASSAAMEKWAFTTSSAVREIETTAVLGKHDEGLGSFPAGKVADRVREIDRSKTLVVLRTTKVLPRVESETAFSGGAIVGFAVVYDWITMTPLCQAAIQAQNGATVEFKKRGIGASTFDEAVMDDLEEQFETQLKASLARITTKVQPAL